MTKEEFALAWQMLRTILNAYLAHWKALTDVKDAAGNITPEMFTGLENRDKPEWQIWVAATLACKETLNALMVALEALDHSDVGELLREDPGPYELDVDPDEIPEAIAAGESDEPTVGSPRLVASTTAYDERQNLLPPPHVIEENDATPQEPDSSSGGGETASPEA